MGVRKNPNLNQESLQVPYFVYDPGLNWPERREGEDWPLDSKNKSLRGLKNRVESLFKKIVLNQSESIF